MTVALAKGLFNIDELPDSTNEAGKAESFWANFSLSPSRLINNSPIPFNFILTSFTGILASAPTSALMVFCFSHAEMSFAETSSKDASAKVSREREHSKMSVSH